MSSFKEILFVVQKTHTDTVGYERIAIELSQRVGIKLRSRLLRVSARQPSSSLLPPSFTRFLNTTKYVFTCIKSGKKGNILYVFGKDMAWSLPFIWLFGTRWIFARIDKKSHRWARRKKWRRIIERMKERVILRFAYRVYVDHESTQKYFQTEYSRKTYLSSYGVEHCKEWKSEPHPKNRKASRDYAISFMPQSIFQAHIALRAFAQYPKYDYYLLIEEANQKGLSELEHFMAYSNIHFVDRKEDFRPLLGNAFLYIHLESSVSARIRLLEAMKSAKKIISLDTPVSRALTGSEALYFKHYTQLLSCLQRAVRQSHYNQGTRMQRLARELSWSIEAQRILQTIDHLPRNVSLLRRDPSDQMEPQLAKPT